MGSDVDVEPGEVHARAVVNGDGAEEGGEIFDAVGGYGEEDYVAYYAENVCEEEELLDLLVEWRYGQGQETHG